MKNPTLTKNTTKIQIPPLGKKNNTELYNFIDISVPFSLCFSLFDKETYIKKRKDSNVDKIMYNSLRSYRKNTLHKKYDFFLFCIREGSQRTLILQYTSKLLQGVYNHYGWEDTGSHNER